VAARWRKQAGVQGRWYRGTLDGGRGSARRAGGSAWRSGWRFSGWWWRRPRGKDDGARYGDGEDDGAWWDAEMGRTTAAAGGAGGARADGRRRAGSGRGSFLDLWVEGVVREGAGATERLTRGRERKSWTKM
jgi:hypothetical protein